MVLRLIFYSLVGIFYRKDSRKITYVPSEHGGRYCLGIGSQLTFKEVKNTIESEGLPRRFKERINFKRLLFGSQLSKCNFKYWFNANLFRIYFLEDIAIGHKEEDASNLHIESLNLKFLKWLKKRCDYSNHVWATETTNK